MPVRTVSPPTRAATAPATSGGRGREQLILTAERLFAERGIGAVSLREIGAAAGHRNNSAAQYHFGSKAGLVEAIFAFRMGAINERRLAALAALDAAGQNLDLVGLVEAYIHPLAESFTDSPGERWYLRFLARIVSDPGWSDLQHGDRAFTAGFDEVLRRLDQALADLPKPLRRERVATMGTLVVHTLAGREGPVSTGSPMALLTADLADMAVGLLTAPVSATTRRQLRRLPNEST